jgi:peptide/nickel transport system substrate-binding protein
MILSGRGWRPWHPGKVFSLLAMVSLLSVASGGVEHEACGGGAAETSGGALVGKLEGPEIVTDPVHFPTSYNEPPTLSELVKTGKLPAVKDRIGTDPLVVKPLHEIGQYGGVWRRGFTGPADTSAGQRVNESDHLTYFDYTATKVVPNVAKAWDVSDGGRTFTFQLRRGMRWSDGHPFTADDFVFWFEDVYLNKDLIPTPSPYFATNGKQGRLMKVDAFTVRYQFSDPYQALPIVMAGQGPIMGHTKEGRTGMGGFAPAHYLKQFHPRYVSKEELEKRVKEDKFDSWVSMFKFKNDWARNPDLPVITPWRTVTPITTPTWTLERNPYSVWVDTAGNQLPYIDRIVLALGENLEVINLRAVAGEYDFQSRHIDLQKLPVLLENQQRGGYKVHLDPSDSEGMALFFNLSYDGDAEVARWIGQADFRRALSLGIERDQLNETFFLGLGVPGSIAPGERTVYSPGAEYRTKWATHDPPQANALLDRIGLDKKDAEGYRLRTDGKGRLRVEIQTFVGFFQATQICEMIREQWRKIGIQADVKEVERSLAYQRRNANEHQIHVDVTWGTENMFGHHMGALFPVDGTSAIGPLYGKWFASGGAQGKEPPPRVRELMEKFRQALGTGGDEHIRTAKEVWKIAVDEVWAIGTVGQSPLITGVRVVKTKMGNIPERLSNGAAAHSPGNNLPQTYFWKR